MNLEEFIHNSNQACDLNALFHIFEKGMTEIGFDQILFALMNDHPALKREAEHGVVKNYPEEWVKYYLAQGYDHIAPVRTLSFTRTGAFTWDGIINSKTLSKKQEKMFNEAEDIKLHCGVGVALRGSGGAVAALGAASTEKGIDLTPFILDKVNLMAHQFYVCFWRLMEVQPLTNTITLTDREMEVLKWSAQGFTKSAVGDRLNISSHTVDYHIRNAMKKIDAKNITSAIAIALNRRLIQI